MSTKSSDCTALHALLTRDRINLHTKPEFRRLGLTFMRMLARLLRLPKGSYKAKFNPAGPAVSGDALLHTDVLTVTLCDAAFVWDVRTRGAPTPLGRKYYRREELDVLLRPHCIAADIGAAMALCVQA